MHHPSQSMSSGSAMRTGSKNSDGTNLRSNLDLSGDAKGGTESFPEFDAGYGLGGVGLNPLRPKGFVNGVNGTTSSADGWHPRRDSRVRWAPHDSSSPMAAFASGTGGQARKRSLSNAIRQIRAGSMSQNAHEIADALRAPISWKLIILCVMWYCSSALTNTSSKSILTSFDKPATLTLVQFAFVSTYCLLFSSLASAFPRLRTAVPALRYPLRYPSREIMTATLPMAAFQIGGHLLSATATSRIPVSLVHTIKGLSPLFTVLTYRFLFDIRYPKATYLSLVPLTLGVMLACSGKHGFAAEFVGIFYALLATLIFVSQNIFSKKLFNEAARAEAEGLGPQSHKLDKLNLLCHSSGMAFLLTAPIWLWSEGIDLIGDFLWDGSLDLDKRPTSFDHGRLTLEFVFNGTFHFGQNILAFILLSIVSPVTYSVASLIKRVFVIIIAILWFQSPTTRMQAVGIGLTFLGLYLYDRSNERNKADQKARTMTVSDGQPLLPINTKQVRVTDHDNSAVSESPVMMGPMPLTYQHLPNGHPLSNGEDSKKSDDLGRGRGSGTSNAAWLLPGAKQEDTWRMGDKKSAVSVS